MVADLSVGQLENEQMWDVFTKLKEVFIRIDIIPQR
jgi:hypothetical protein